MRQPNAQLAERAEDAKTRPERGLIREQAREATTATEVHDQIELTVLRGRIG